MHPLTKVIVNEQEFDLYAVVNLMDNDLRNQLHDKFESDRSTTPQQFVDDYCVMHAEKFGDQFVVN
jgi:hypothetical protein